MKHMLNFAESFSGAIFAHTLVLGSIVINPSTAQAEPSLSVVYPPPEHKTTAERIFFIGTASPSGEVLINGKKINRSPQGYFAPSFPLAVGENSFTLRHQEEELEITVTRIDTTPQIPEGANFAENSLVPNVTIARLPGELICFSAIAAPDARVNVRLGRERIALFPETTAVQLPPNYAVLTSENQPKTITSISKYQGCKSFTAIGNLGKPEFEVSLKGNRETQATTGEIEILSPNNLEVIEVIADAGVARTGASTSYSRLSPLPKGTRATVTGKQGEWLRLDYGGWIKQSETQTIPDSIPPKSLIRSITSRQLSDSTEIIFPLQVPVPIAIQQGDDTITLTLHNTTAQTDTIKLNDNPVIKRLDWQQVTPTQIDYTFHLKTKQQWGYDVRYEGTSLILSLAHAPRLSIRKNQPLQGIKILLDPGHGGNELGARGGNGYPEKAINLVISQLLKQRLTNLGATVYLTREKDIDVSLQDRVKAIQELKPDIALSIHYNALPDSGDAEKTQGISTFWYHPQAHSLAVFLHNYLTTKLNRPSYGIFWNNLALTRPHYAPTVLLELGFMINPWELEWITDTQQQEKLTNEIAKAIEIWFSNSSMKM